MTAIIEEVSNFCVEQGILEHPAWYGDIAGLPAEKSLRGHRPYVYLLRAGERPLNYYVSFVLPDLSVRHQPIEITVRPEGWYCENMATTGPYTYESISDMVHLVMHCESEECRPLVRIEIK